MAASPFDSLRSRIADSTASLNERERRLLMVMGAVVATFVVLLPVLLLSQAIGAREEQNADLRDLVQSINRARQDLARRQAEEAAARALYQRSAPPLGSFIEAQARGIDANLQVREVTDQPERVIQDFRRRNVRATLPNVDLRDAILMLAAIENSEYPVALERVQIEHFRSGTGYNVQLGVISYELEEPEAPEDEPPAAGSRMGRAGPPSP